LNDTAEAVSLAFLRDLPANLLRGLAALVVEPTVSRVYDFGFQHHRRARNREP
jgi:hypothetical protein